MANKTISADYTSWTGTSSADKVKIDWADRVRVNTGKGNDSIYNYLGYYDTISAGAGNDTITFYSGNGSSINAGSGADRISLRGGYSYVITVMGGTGNDTVYGSGNKTLHQYVSGDGKDVIYNWSANDTISITGAKYTRSTVGNDVVLKVGSGAITLKNANGKTINIKGTLAGGKNINNTSSYKTISGTSYEDSIRNTGSSVKIYGGAGNDTVWSTNGSSSNVTISGGDGDNRLELWGKKSSIIGGKDKDTIFVHGKNVTVNSGAGNDSIENWDDNVGRSDDGDGKARIYGGAGNDSVSNFGSGATINTGTGNDVITFKSHIRNGTVYDSKRNLIQYAVGDGHDTIYNIGSTDTISIGGAQYTRSTVNNDVVLMTGSGSITLKDAKDKAFNVRGTLAGGNSNIPSDALKYNGHSYYVFNSGMTWYQAKAYCESLGGHLVTITDSGEQNAVKNLLSSKGTKNSYWLGGYKSSSNKWQWVTNETWSYSNWGVNQPDNAYGFENQLMMYRSTGNGWPFGTWNDIREDGTCNNESFFGASNFGFICEWETIKSSGNVGVTLNNALSSKTLNGTSYNDSIYNSSSGHHVTMYAGAGNDTITNYGDTVSIAGGTGNDFIYSYSYYSTIDGDAGDDRISLNSSGHHNVIRYYSGEGNDTIYNLTATDTISIASGSYTRSTVDNDVIIAVGTGSITAKNAKSKKVNVVGTPAIVVGHGGTDINNDIANLLLTGTSYNDSIYNNASSVTISTGGGNDTIYNYNGDKSSIDSGAGNDSIFAYDNDNVTVNAGDGSDTIRGGYYSSKINGGAGADFISINGSFFSNTVDGGDGADTIIALGGSLNGGAGDDKISLNSGSYYSDATVKGGTGNDSLWGDKSVDTFIYASGDGNDVIYGFDNTDMLQITGAFSASYNQSKKEIYFKVGSTSNALTLKNFDATSFNINGTNYKISGSKFVKK